MHKQKNGKLIACCFWICKRKRCKQEGVPIKELLNGTGQLFRHFKTCNEALWRKFRLASPHSKAQLDEDGNEIEVSLEPSTVAPRSNSCSDLSVSSAPAALVVQGILLALVGGGGLREGGQRHR
jgi:hypothetical protein